MNIETYEVIKTFVFAIPGMQEDVVGTLVKRINSSSANPYQWSSSHYYKPSASGGVYYPSGTSGPSLEAVEASLMGYINGFTTEFGVERKA
ncbi:MAG: hypothetical protein IOC55_14175 [Methylobacterium sp.]|nr:hypothetical protein [Methylobacterium sp.]